MRIPLNMGVKGRVTVTLTNTETGERQEVKGDNLILNHYLDWAMTQGLGILGTTTFNRCYIGTGDTPPQPEDTTFNGTQLAMSASSVLTKDLNAVDQKLEVLGTIRNLDIAAPGGLAVTPDEEILLVGNDSNLRAFTINESDWTLTPIQVDDFVGLTGVRALCIKNDLLFVGINQAPWGKLYKRVENNFEFFADVPGLSTRPTRADITFDDKYLLLRSPLRVFSIGDGTLTEIDSSSVNSYNHICVFASNSHDMFSGSYSSGSFILRRYSIVDNALVFQESFVLPIDYSPDLIISPILDLDAVGDSIYAYGRIRLTGGVNWGIGVSSLFMSNGVWKVSTRSFGTLYAGSNPSHISGVAVVNPSLFFILGDFGVGIMHPRLRYPHSNLVGIDTTENSSWVWLDAKQVLLIRDVSDSPANLKIIKPRVVTSLQSYARQWTFPAGVGTGIVNRIGLQANSGTGANGNNRHVAQIVLPEDLEKTNLHQLDVIWEIEVENPGVWEGVIPGGSRDGSDLAWRVTINEEQFYNLVQIGYSIPANWFGITGTPNVRIGTSNEESDLVFDRENIRGEEIEYISSTAIRVVNPYVPGSLKRTIRLFLEVNQGNGQIGEIVFGGSTSSSSLARITFDPPLDKPPDVGEGANPYRIYLDLEIGWQRGE